MTPLQAACKRWRAAPKGYRWTAKAVLCHEARMWDAAAKESEWSRSERRDTAKAMRLAIAVLRAAEGK